MGYYEPAPDWNSPAAGRCRVGMVRLRDHLAAEFDGTNLGCYSNRPKTAGSTPSLHRDGRAIDVGFADMERREEAFRWLIANADALNVQMILNYRNGGYGGTRWRIKYNASDTSAGLGTWGSSGHWLHIERTRAGADDQRQIAEIVQAIPPRRVDLLDISVYQTITKYADLPDVPIVHRVVTKEGDLDDRFQSRMPTLSQRTEIFGGYVVLVGVTAIRQMRIYIDAMRPFWRDGAFTQLDVETWAGFPTVTVDELAECIRLHDEAFGPSRLAIYMNPTTHPALWAEFVARYPNMPRWVPGYRTNDDIKAGQYGAAIHQWTDAARPSGFTGPVDANEVRDWDAVRYIAGLDRPPPPTAPKESVMVEVATGTLELGNRGRVLDTRPEYHDQWFNKHIPAQKMKAGAWYSVEGVVGTGQVCQVRVACIDADNAGDLIVDGVKRRPGEPLPAVSFPEGGIADVVLLVHVPDGKLYISSPQGGCHVVIDRH